MNARSLLRYSPDDRMFRVLRVVWERGIVGDGRGYSAKLTLAFRPVLFAWSRGAYGWSVTCCGVRLHYARSYGGRFV